VNSITATILHVTDDDDDDDRRNTVVPISRPLVRSAKKTKKLCFFYPFTCLPLSQTEWYSDFNCQLYMKHKQEQVC